jgi:hypothetical protein
MKKVILIAIILILLICVGIGIILEKNSVKYSESAKKAIENKMMSGKEEKCLNSGGKVSIVFCCKSAGDFPNTCLTETCDCLSKDSYEIKVCECGLERCFDGEKCLMPEVSRPSGIDKTI